MTGALKHLFDLVGHRASAGKPVILAATGGSIMHGLVTEYSTRPLFGFLNALTLPTTIYAVESDFDAYRVSAAKLEERIEGVSEEAAMQLGLTPFVVRLRAGPHPSSRRLCPLRLSSCCIPLVFSTRCFLSADRVSVEAKSKNIAVWADP